GFFAGGGTGAAPAATVNGSPQLGHLTRRPTRLSGTLAAWPQPGHLVMIMGCLGEGLAPRVFGDLRRAPQGTRGPFCLPRPAPPVPVPRPRENAGRPS